MAYQLRKPRPRRASWQLGALALASFFLASCGGGGGGRSIEQGTPVQISTVSNRADLVSGGDALVEVTAPPGLIQNGYTVKLNGADVTSSFSETEKGRLRGTLTGLVDGENTVTAQAGPSDVPGAKLVITNHSRSGPIYSGPAHITPFYCATPTPQAGSGNTPNTNPSGLSGQPEESCNIATETKLYYRTTTAGCSSNLPDPFTNTPATGAFAAQPPATANPCFKAFTTGTTPADMATVTTDNGQTVPYIVRVERGTMNRGIYDIAVLFNPAQPWTATAPQAQWNGKVYYSFGASTGQPRRQARPDNGNRWTLQEEQLKRGFLFVQNSMTDSLKNSNRVMMTETVMMMKEHIGDNYGEIKYTLAAGCSGGSINSNTTLSIFPGLLDGVITNCTYPDSETTTMEVADCVLLSEAYQKSAMLNVWAGLTLNQTQINARKAAINGHPDQTGCHAWYNFFGSNGRPGVFFQRSVSDQITGAITQSATATNNCELPNSAVYDPANPAATASLPRCHAWGWAENIFGRIGSTPTPRDTRDNVGVQYGLKALLNGTITPEEFVTLNEIIGGTNKDSEFQAARSSADVEALSVVYRSGIVASGKNLAKAPIIDLRGWDDSLINTPPGSILLVTLFGIHHQWFSWGIRDRIVRDAGDADNQALWRFARGAMPASAALNLEALNNMDQWLTTLVTDTTGRSIEQKVRAARPASSRDFCYLTNDTAQSTKVFDQATCDADPFLKPAASPRQVAGGPRSEDVLKCQLKPLNPADYGSVIFMGAQWTRLSTVFSSGVCDWSKPGVQQQDVQNSWQSPLNFKAAPGQGVPLGAAPTSSRL